MVITAIQWAAQDTQMREVMKPYPPDRVATYFRRSAPTIAIVAVSGVVYNAGLALGPYLEGQMVQHLLDIVQGTGTLQGMLALAAIYLAVIALVQGMRAVKRFYVRRFANDTARSMRGTL